MNYVLCCLLVFLTLSSCRSDDFDPEATAPVVAAYDTVEIEYQKMGDLALELIATVSEDPEVPVAPINQALEKQPVVSLDFGKPVTTRRDLANFARHQENLQHEIDKLFKKLDNNAKWRNAVALSDFKQRYKSRLDSIGIAADRFNEIVSKSSYQIQIPAKTASVEK